MKTTRYRDLSITHLPKGYIITACDSSGSIGEKPEDFLPCPAELVGRCAVRVPLLEVMAFGAEVIGVTNAVSGEMEPTGRKIIDGIKTELKNAGVEPDVLNGSTEENMPTKMTAVGVSVIAYMEDLPPTRNLSSGDKIVILGKMKVGEEVFEGDESEMATYDDIRYLHSLSYVKEIVPLGSKGVTYEASLLADLNGLTFIPDEDTLIDLTRSAGPATAVIAVVDADGIDDILKNDKVCYVGELI